MELSDQDLETLTYTLLGEARGEGAEGMLAVANVIRNRMDSPIYPDDPVEVATQPWQFSTNNGPNMGGGNQTATRREVRPGDPLYTAAERIVRGAILAETPTLPDITGRAINYHANSISPRWATGATTRWGTVQINNHTFYARQPVPPLDIPSVLSMIDTDAGPSWMSNARQFSETRAEQRIIRATERADKRRRMFEAAGGASVGSTTSTAMSVTSELGGGKGFAGSIARQVIPSEDYAKARDLASFGTLLDERVSMTAPNPAPTAGSVKVNGVAEGATGAGAAARGAASAAARRGTPLPAPAPLTFAQPNARTADSGLITYIRKTVPIDAYGNPVPDATLVVAPVAKKSPTVRLAEAKVKVGAAVAALGAVKVVPKVTAVAAVAAGAGSAMASAAGKVSAGRLKAGSPNTDINPAVKENPFVYVPKFAADQDATDSAVPTIRPKAPAPAVQSNALRLARMRADPPGSFPKVTELAAFRTEGAGTRTAEEMLNGTGYEKLGAALDTMKAPANDVAPIPRPASERPKVKLSAGADIVKPGKVSTQTVAPQPMPAGARPQAKPTVKAPTPMPAAARPKAKPVVTAAPVRKPAPSSTSTMADTAVKATIRGTSNAGRTYEVGKTYTAAGYTYVAKSDGTFQKTGKV